MQYLLMIYSQESLASRPGTPEFDQMIGAYGKFTEEMQTSGRFIAGEALHPTATATSLRIRNGETLMTDGPFAESKEQLGGYYVLNCVDLDDALACAAKIPSASEGTIEVRPIVDWSPVPAGV